jgi:hypothetical protein
MGAHRRGAEDVKKGLDMAYFRKPAQMSFFGLS